MALNGGMYHSQFCTVTTNIPLVRIAKQLLFRVNLCFQESGTDMLNSLFFPPSVFVFAIV